MTVSSNILMCERGSRHIQRIVLCSEMFQTAPAGGAVRAAPAEHKGGAGLHELHLHGHADGEERAHAVRVPQAQDLLQGETRHRISSECGIDNAIHD